MPCLLIVGSFVITVGIIILLLYVFRRETLIFIFTQYNLEAITIFGIILESCIVILEKHKTKVYKPVFYLSYTRNNYIVKLCIENLHSIVYNLDINIRKTYFQISNHALKKYSKVDAKKEKIKYFVFNKNEYYRSKLYIHMIYRDALYKKYYTIFYKPPKSYKFSLVA